MSKLSDAKEILNALQVPTKQQNGMCCCVLLAMAGLTEELPWSEATNNWIRIHDVIAFANSNYGMTYAENSRETFRKQAMHHFRNAAFIEDNGKATNSPNYRYRLTDEMLRLIQSFGQNMWGEQLFTFLENHDTLVEIYASKRAMRKMPVKINGADFTFSPGKHNQLQKAIIEEFAPRFAPNSECLYVGDTVEKDLVKNEDKLRELGFADPEAAERALKDSLPQNPVPVTRDAKQPNVIFALMESMGRDEFDSYDPKTNDTLGALARSMKSGYVSHQGIPVGNGTFVSLEGLLYDSPLSPISQSRYGHEQFPFSNVLAFRRAGYRTIFLTSCTENWRELNRSLPLHGFDEVIGASKIKGRFPEAEMGVWGVGDKWTFRYAKELLEKASKDGKPVFLMILSATNHPPHHLPDHETGAAVDPAKLPPFLIQKPHDEMVSMLQTYSYAANALGNFVEGVRSEPWGKNTLIAATGDHNARFSYQPNGWYHHANGVPILFWLPDGFKPAAVPSSSQWVSHRDIFPTLRGIALGEKPALYQGRDIFEPGIPDAADTFTGIGKYGYAIGSAGAAGVDGSGKLLCFRWQGDRLITSSCTPELRKLGTIAAACRALSDYTVRSALLHEKAEKRSE